jgi:hypothetical protein
VTDRLPTPPDRGTIAGFGIPNGVPPTLPMFYPEELRNYDGPVQAHPDDAVIMYGYTAESLAGRVVERFGKSVTLFQNTA